MGNFPGLNIPETVNFTEQTFKICAGEPVKLNHAIWKSDKAAIMPALQLNLTN